MSLKVTVCQIYDEIDRFFHDWEQLIIHVRDEKSQIVLLPEMPFSPWFATIPHPDEVTWNTTIQRHEQWLMRLYELAPAHILSSRPVNRNSRRLNEGFLWQPDTGYHPIHVKHYLPNEEGAWEASWYQPGEADFTPFESQTASIGMLICSELWALEKACAYGKNGVHILVTPRLTQDVTTEKWLVGGRAAAILAGAFSLSSNKVSPPNSSDDFGGTGWIISPDGDVLAITSQQQPFVTLDIDLQWAERAKRTYPRYLFGP